MLTRTSKCPLKSGHPVLVSRMVRAMACLTHYDIILMSKTLFSTLIITFNFYAHSFVIFPMWIIMVNKFSIITKFQICDITFCVRLCICSSKYCYSFSSYNAYYLFSPQRIWMSTCYSELHCVPHLLHKLVEGAPTVLLLGTETSMNLCNIRNSYTYR